MPRRGSEDVTVPRPSGRSRSASDAGAGSTTGVRRQLLLPRGWSPGTRPARLAGAFVGLGDAAALVAAASVAGSGSPAVWAHAAFCLVALAAVGSYRPRFNLSVVQHAPLLVMLLAVPALGVVAVSTTAVVPPAVLVQVALAPVLVTALRAATYSAIRMTRRRGHLSEPVAVLGSGQVADALMRHMCEHPEYGLVPVGYLDDQPNEDFEAPWLGTVHHLEGVVRRHALRRLVVAYSSTREHSLVGVLRTAVHQGLDIHVVPRFFDIAGTAGSTVFDDVWGIPLHPLRLRSMHCRAWKIKRGVDVVVALTALILGVPLFLLCTVAVRLSGPGPILFRQQRLGQNSRRFEVLKFRTLHLNDDSDTAWSVLDDARQTRAGRLLRRTNLDEIPQLWNVVRGDMSLVGPRPERPHFAEIFEESVPDYGARHRAPVGITGWAQVHGLRGDTSIDDRARFDNRYIDNWSLWQDLVIVLRTVKQMLTRGS